MAVSNTIIKGANSYTVYTSTGIDAGVTLYTSATLTTPWTANYGTMFKISGTIDYIDIGSDGYVQERYYAFKLWNGPYLPSESTLYTKGPLAVDKILYNNLYPLKPAIIAGSTTTNWAADSGLTMVEAECSTGKIVKIRTAPFVFFKRIEKTIATDQTSRNGKAGYVYQLVASTGLGGQPPYNVTTGAGVNFGGLVAGEIKFDDRRINTTRTARFADTTNRYFNEYNPTVQHIANPNYYTITFQNGNLDVVFNDILNNVYDIMVNIEYQISIYNVGVVKPWSSDTSWTNLPLRDLQLEIRDEYGSYIMIPVRYVSTELKATYNKIEEAKSSLQIIKNNKVSYVYNISGGTPPYSVTTYGEQFDNISSGPTIQFDYSRNNDYRSITFSDSGTSNVNVTLPTVQIVASSTYFSNYTFTNDGTLTLVPNYVLSVDTLVVPKYRIQDIISGSYLSNWQTTPVFTGLPAKDVYLEVTDEYSSYFKMVIHFIPGESVSIITDLGDISFTNDPMVAIVNSSIKTTQNMNYLYTMYDKDGNQLLKTRVYPDIENNYLGIYNMNMIYNNYVTTSCNFDIDNAIVTDNIYKYSYNVNDGSISGGVTSSDKYCMKGGTVYGENFDITNYIGEPTNVHRFITKWDGNRLLRTDDYGVVNYLNGNFTDVSINTLITHIAFVKYKIGEQVHTFTSDDAWYHDNNRVNFIPFGIINTNFSNKLLSIPYGPKNYEIAVGLGNIVDDNGSTILSNILLDSDTDYYEMHLVNKTGDVFTKVSTSIVVNLNKSEMCSKYVPTRFIWLDMYGNYNTFTFNGMNVKEYDIDRNSVNNDYYTVQNSGQWGYQLGNRGRKTINIKKIEVHRASSGWLNDELSKNLIDLYTSSDIYVIIGGELYPIIIKTNNVEEKTVSNNRLFNHTISYEMAYDINTNE